MVQKHYDEVRHTLKTGDLVLFNGRGLVSKVIQLFSRSKWSHIGMVLVLPTDNMVLLWESTALAPGHDGVRTVSLRWRLDTYEAKEIAIKRAKAPLALDQQDGLLRLRRELRGRYYERNLWQLMSAALDGWKIFRNKRKDLRTLFCSELVAEALQRIGFIDDAKPSNEYIPRDFAEEGLEEYEDELVYLVP